MVALWLQTLLQVNPYHLHYAVIVFLPPPLELTVIYHSIVSAGKCVRVLNLGSQKAALFINCTASVSWYLSLKSVLIAHFADFRVAGSWDFIYYLFSQICQYWAKTWECRIFLSTENFCCTLKGIKQVDEVFQIMSFMRRKFQIVEVSFFMENSCNSNLLFSKKTISNVEFQRVAKSCITEAAEAKFCWSGI